MEEFPSHVVCKWIGNSIKIAEKHYLQVTDDHFKKATQNPTQSMPDSACQFKSPKKQTPQMPVFGITGHGLTLQIVGDEGLEQLRFSSGKTGYLKTGDAESDVNAANLLQISIELKKHLTQEQCQNLAELLTVKKHT